MLGLQGKGPPPTGRPQGAVGLGGHYIPEGPESGVGVPTRVFPISPLRVSSQGSGAL